MPRGMTLVVPLSFFTLVIPRGPAWREGSDRRRSPSLFSRAGHALIEAGQPLRKLEFLGRAICQTTSEVVEQLLKFVEDGSECVDRELGRMSGSLR